MRPIGPLCAMLEISDVLSCQNAPDSGSAYHTGPEDHVCDQISALMAAQSGRIWWAPRADWLF